MIDTLKEKLQVLYDAKETFRFNTSYYKDFHDSITEFVYKNKLDETDEWKNISENLLYKLSQYMTTHEADIISYNLEKLKRIMLKNKNEAFWIYIHPKIKELIFTKFNGEHYADCVETAFKEINSRLKKIYKKERNQEKDGADLMHCIFTSNNPLLRFEDNSTTSGENVQKGYMDIFAGAMTGIRNPKAHENQTITKDAAIKRLIFASLLMDKIDEAIEYTGI